MKVEDLKGLKIAICVPSRYETTMNFCSFLLHTTKTFDAYGIKWDYFNVQRLPTHRARNWLVDEVYKKMPDFDYILFIDDDTYGDPTSYIRMLLTGEEMISGVYCYKRPPFMPVVRDYNMKMVIDWKVDSNNPLIPAFGGLMLVHKNVFDLHKRELTNRFFEYPRDGSEDVYFWNNCVKLGVKAKVMVTEQFKHWGVEVDLGMYANQMNNVKEQLGDSVEWHDGVCISKVSFRGVE